MSVDFALKDLVRKKEQSISYLITIILCVASIEFLIYTSNSLGLNIFNQNQINHSNPLFFSGSIKVIFLQFHTYIIILTLILGFTIILIIGTSFIVNKNKDISIMKALGTLPNKLYTFYLIELYILFFLGFGLGIMIGLISFSIYFNILKCLGFLLFFQIDYFFTLIFLGACIIGIFLVPGYKLRKLGKSKINTLQSRDIPVGYSASKKVTFLPKWLSRLGFTFKLSIIGILRKKGEFKRYFVSFFILSLVLFSFGLGVFILRESSVGWVQKSQSNNLIAIGHQDVLSNYSKMYSMFSNSEVFVDKTDINFLDSKYIFNFSELNEITSESGISKIDPRIISFCDVREMTGILIREDGGYTIVGKERTGNYPIMGVNQTDLIQSFEVEGDLSINSTYMSIGDGLAYNFFDYPFYQELSLTPYHRSFEISGILIDSFYNGYCGYLSLEEYRAMLNFSNQEINLLLLKVNKDLYSQTLNNLSNIINSNLDSEFSYIELNSIFNENIRFLNSLMIYPYFFLFLIFIVIISTFYHYQKAGINQKVKDFLIMRSIGTKSKKLRKILFLEAFYAIIPSCLLSLAIGMIINRLLLIERAIVPPLLYPFFLISIIILFFLLVNFLSVLPIVKRIKNSEIMRFSTL
ncbi:MAG: ABC transporter permease [Promethearchaeota archaeon]|nr:MAG: ABC transporter permease [Candidatus Lokiarchaeota archaeon]